VPRKVLGQGIDGLDGEIRPAGPDVPQPPLAVLQDRFARVELVDPTEDAATIDRPQELSIRLAYRQELANVQDDASVTFAGKLHTCRRKRVEVMNPQVFIDPGAPHRLRPNLKVSRSVESAVDHEDERSLRDVTHRLEE
jgi:hypothetical protein